MIARLNLGGPAQQACLLSGRRMDPDRYETLLVHGSLPPGEESMADMADREGARTVFLPDLGQPVRPAADASAMRRLAGIVRSFRPHIVHTHTAKAGMVGRLAPRAARPRPLVVHTYHGHVLEGYFGPLRRQLFIRLEQGLARLSDRLIGVSEATVEDLVRLGVAPRERFRVIRLGLDLAPFAEAGEDRELRGELGVGEDEVLFGYAGRVVPIKRLDVMLRGLAAARKRGAPVRLAVVGDGEQRPGLERLARDLGIGEQVAFLGYRRDLPRIAAATDAAALSSDNEGTPVSLIEAGAAGRCAVATDVGGVAEVVTPDSGLLVGAGDHEAFGAALAQLAESRELREQMGGRARKHVLARYSAERLVADIDSLYEELFSDEDPSEGDSSEIFSS